MDIADQLEQHTLSTRRAWIGRIIEELWFDPNAAMLFWDDLPANAQAYLNRLEALCEVPIAIISTGPERDETILRQHPFK